MDFQITERTAEEFKIVAFKGRFDAHNSDSIETKLNGLIDARNHKFIVDVRDVHYLGSCGIRIFISITHRLRDFEGKFAIINMLPSGRKILKAMEIEHLFHIFETEKEALQFLRAG